MESDTSGSHQTNCYLIDSAEYPTEQYYDCMRQQQQPQQHEFKWEHKQVLYGPHSVSGGSMQNNCTCYQNGNDQVCARCQANQEQTDTGNYVYETNKNIDISMSSYKQQDSSSIRDQSIGQRSSVKEEPFYENSHVDYYIKQTNQKDNVAATLEQCQLIGNSDDILRQFNHNPQVVTTSSNDLISVVASSSDSSQFHNTTATTTDSLPVLHFDSDIIQCNPSNSLFYSSSSNETHHQTIDWMRDLHTSTDDADDQEYRRSFKFVIDDDGFKSATSIDSNNNTAHHRASANTNQSDRSFVYETSYEQQQQQHQLQNYNLGQVYDQNQPMSQNQPQALFGIVQGDVASLAMNFDREQQLFNTKAPESLSSMSSSSSINNMTNAHQLDQVNLTDQNDFHVKGYSTEQLTHDLYKIQDNRMMMVDSTSSIMNNRFQVPTSGRNFDRKSDERFKIGEQSTLNKGSRAKSRRKNTGALGKVNGKLWEFIRDLLLNERTNPTFIRWERKEDGIFRFVQSNKVAKMWGERKQNPKMTYEKLSRAMRYYYKSKVLLPVFGRRLVYKFGPNSSGWNNNTI